MHTGIPVKCKTTLDFPVREAAKKVLFLVAGPLRGGEVNGCATKEKRTFFNVRKKVPMATKPRGGGAKGLSGRATKKITFCGFPYSRGIFFFSVNKFPQNFVFYKIATKFRAFSKV